MDRIDDDAPQFQIGRSGADYVRITALAREHPDATDWADGNWIVCSIGFKLGEFKGQIRASLRSEEVGRFLRGLEGMSEALAGIAQLASMETWIELAVEMSSQGQLEIDGRLTDRPGLGNQLEFKIEGLDQSDLPPLIKNVQRVLEAFPERAR